ncbi:hypothetical protein BVAVS116_D0003 (plasmid) [Borreliella valaisiana VS116]|uniref:Uncharacterized protein n=1 Tax=Borreliella valaisiana VS116 TaxID=445987 RepID=C0R8V8_BORVA|nr:hypothetical protein BVAVS116_D0003 [Borreliella valaisiana VS116]
MDIHSQLTGESRVFNKILYIFNCFIHFFSFLVEGKGFLFYLFF